MNRAHHIRVSIISIILLLALTVTSKAEGIYAGGAGGGYASISIGGHTSALAPDSLAKKAFDVTVYPNPLKLNDVFKAKIAGLPSGSRVNVIVTDLIGSRLLNEEIEASTETILNLPYDRMGKGIYLVTFQHNSVKITRRFTITQ